MPRPTRRPLSSRERETLRQLEQIEQPTPTQRQQLEQLQRRHERYGDEVPAVLRDILRF